MTKDRWDTERKATQDQLLPLTAMPNAGGGLSSYAFAFYGMLGEGPDPFNSRETKAFIKASWQPLAPDPKVGVWTDDYSNILRVFMW
jgi:hypothetical protein